MRISVLQMFVCHSADTKMQLSIIKSSNIYNVNNANRNELIVSNIVDSMSDSDIMSFLTYQNAGGMNTDFTSVKSTLKWDPIYYSRTANASYGIGLAAVILNDEAMGYNSKIVFITDSSVSVDSRFLKLAINNKIPIYFSVLVILIQLH